MMKQRIKALVRRWGWMVNFVPFYNQIRLRGCSFSRKGKPMSHCVIDCRGEGNVIELEQGGYLQDCRLYIRGNHNRIIIGRSTSAIHAEFYIEDDHNQICVGENTTFAGKIHLACTEGRTIRIGDRCLFSSDITFRTGDSHSILNMDGKRINPAQDITIKDHVWVGHKATITKGVTVEHDSIVGTGALVSKSCTEPNVILAGVPAKVVKQQINWDSKRLPIEE